MAEMEELKLLIPGDSKENRSIKINAAISTLNILVHLGRGDLRCSICGEWKDHTELVLKCGGGGPVCSQYCEKERQNEDKENKSS